MSDDLTQEISKRIVAGENCFGMNPTPQCVLKCAEIEKLRAQIELFREYVAFLNKANEGPIVLAWNHGWRCPAEDVEKGKEYRKKLGLEE